MPAIRRNLLIEQGATGPIPSLFTWQNPRHVFAAAAVTGTFLSGLTEPVWPTSNCDCDEIVDNEVTWACNRVATQKDWTERSLWCASKAYAVGDLVITPKTPVDLTGYSGVMQIRTREADSNKSEVLFTLSTTIDGDGNGIYLGGTAGTVEIVIQAQTSEGFEWDAGEYDLELTSPTSGKYPAGFVTRFLQGTVTVSKERTRP